MFARSFWRFFATNHFSIIHQRCFCHVRSFPINDRSTFRSFRNDFLHCSIKFDQCLLRSNICSMSSWYFLIIARWFFVHLWIICLWRFDNCSTIVDAFSNMFQTCFDHFWIMFWSFSKQISHVSTFFGWCFDHSSIFV